jgi:hypothetical protein
MVAQCILLMALFVEQLDDSRVCGIGLCSYLYVLNKECFIV